MKKKQWRACLARGIAPLPGKEVVKIKYGRKPWVWNTYFAGEELPVGKRIYDYFWMEKFPTANEYRVMIVRFEDMNVIYVFKKTRTDRVVDEQRRKFKYGWRFTQMREPLVHVKIDVIHKILDVIQEFSDWFAGKKYIGVDYAVGEDGRHVVFEINRAPGVNEPRAERYEREHRILQEAVANGTVEETARQLRVIALVR